MSDFSMPNEKPGTCCKCQGTGVYRWNGGVRNGKPVVKSGSCHSCRGTGNQDQKQIARNVCYNRHKVVTL